MDRQMGRLWKRLALRTQVALLTSLLMALLAWGVSWLAANRAVTEIEQRTGDVLVDSARYLAELLDRAMWSRTNEIRMLADLVPFRELHTGGEVEGVLASLQKSLPVFTWIGLTDRSGKVIAATGDILLGRDISARPVFQQGVRGFFVGDVHEAVLLASLLPNPDGSPMEFVDIASAVRNPQGEVVGVLAAHLSWAWAREVQRSMLAPAGQQQGAQMFVIAEDDQVLLASAPGLQGSRAQLQGLRPARLGQAHWRVERWPDGRDYLTGYALADGHLEYPGLGWVVVARKPVEEAFAEAVRLRGYMAQMGLVIALLFVALAWWLAGGVARPLRALARGAEQLRKREIERLPAIGGSVEMRSLSLVLDQLVSSLERREYDLKRMSGLANTDPLTGLPNRLALNAFVSKVTQRDVLDDGEALAWLAIDLDGFKAVNDTYGHAAGDALLVDVSARLQACVRQDDLLARHGGDEFSALIRVSAYGADEEALQVAARMLEAVREPVDFQGLTLRVGSSVGIAIWPRDASALEVVAERADQALYAAKGAGRGRAVCWSVVGDRSAPDA